ncbi:hypothetical protein NMY22_g18043 [Coprinellus aureogranulatus]|nr:hypothetical protein NMY22_g18043 [Coprinellus aureogranulatus]
MLHRSKDSPIALEAQVIKDQEFNEVLTKLMSQSYRFRYIDLSGTYNPNILCNVSGAAPVLEKLHLGCTTFPTPKLPGNLLQGGTPILRS